MEHQRQVTSATLAPGLRRPPGATLIELPVIIRRSAYDRRLRPLGKVPRDVLTVMEVDPGLSDDGGGRRPRGVKVGGLSLALIAAALSWRPAASSVSSRRGKRRTLA